MEGKLTHSISLEHMLWFERRLNIIVGGISIGPK